MLKYGVLPLVISTIALSLFLKESVKDFYSSQAQPFPALVPAIDIHVFGAVVSTQSLAVLVVAIVTVAALHLLLNKTRLGRSMQATAQNPTLARILGIPVQRMVLYTFLINAVLVAIASILISPIYLAKFTNGETLGTGGVHRPPSSAASIRCAARLWAASFSAFSIICRRPTCRRNTVAPFPLIDPDRGDPVAAAGPASAGSRSARYDAASRILAAAAAAIAAVALPFFLKPFGIYLISMWAVLTIAAIGLNLTLGYAGQVSMAQGAFVGIGAYTVALLDPGRLSVCAGVRRRRRAVFRHRLDPRLSGAARCSIITSPSSRWRSRRWCSWCCATRNG